MIKRLRTFIHWLAVLPRPFAIALAVLGYLAVSLLDKLTGTSMSLTLLYLAPISLAAWRVGQKPAIGLAIVCGITQALLNPQDWRSTHVSFGVQLWNLVIVSAIFILVAWLVHAVQHLLEIERKLARTDFLTGTRNRMAFLNELDQEILRALRHGQSLSLIYVDLDNFKLINDRLGHREGDALLRAVGQALLQSVRGIDTVCRLGGDEFVILLPNADSDAASIVAPRIRQALLDRMKAGLWPVTFSVGVLTCPVPPGSAEELIHRADELMYRAKQSGKDKMVFSLQSA